MRARVVVGLVVISLVAAVGAAAPGSGAKAVATESVSATGLSITPQVAYERAMLRVTGPQGYQGRQKFEAGAAIQVDLASFGSKPAASQNQRRQTETEVVERALMPDGRYKFEVVFYASGRKAGVHTGMFFVEGGLAVSRDAKRAQLSSLRGDLAKDRQSLAARGGRSQMSTERSGAPFSTDASAPQISSEAPSPEGAAVAGYLVVYPSYSPGYSWAGLGNYNLVSYQYQTWSMVHSNGDLNFKFGGYPYPLGYVNGYPYPQVTFEPAYYGQGAEVGIGTYAPYATLDVAGTYYFYGPRQVAISGWYGYQTSQGVGAAGLWFYDDDNEPIVLFTHSADAYTMVVDAEGVGIGDFYDYPYYPAVDLHVRDEDPQLLVESISSTTTGRTLAYLKNPGDVRMFWENTDSGDIWQMSLLSTVLQMSTPTGDGKFRVRKNGGLQALRGSTTILDLNSTGDLTVKSVTQTSSREQKLGFESVDAVSVLEKVAGLPISEWSYRADNPSVRHIGPMAEDFHAAFGLGKTDKGITSVDTSGIALAAIQGLNQKLVEKDARISELEQRLLELEELVQALAEH